jgi:hypothetical protein
MTEYELPYNVFDELKELMNGRVEDSSLEVWEFKHTMKTRKKLKEIDDLWFTSEFEQFYYSQFNLGEIETKMDITNSENDTRYLVKKVTPAGKFLDMFQRFFSSALPDNLSWHSYQEKKKVEHGNEEACLYFTNRFSESWDAKIPIMKGYHLLQPAEADGEYSIQTKIFVQIVRPQESGIFGFLMSPLISAAEILLKKNIENELDQLFSTLAVVEMQ